MTKVIKEGLFALRDGSHVKFVCFDDNTTALYTLDNSNIITATSPLLYTQIVYNHILAKHDLQNKSLHILHLGSGFGYDLLFISNLLKSKGIENCKMTGVDFTDYGNLRVDTNLFHHPVTFCLSDAVAFVQAATPDSHRFLILCVDLFTHLATPNQIIYSSNFWQNIYEKINPDIIIINKANDNTTFQVLDKVFDDIFYTQLYHKKIEVYERKADKHR